MGAKKFNAMKREHNLLLCFQMYVHLEYNVNMILLKKKVNI